MSNNTPQSPQGVTGNTPAALTNAAGTTATGVRGLFRKDLLKWWGYGLITLFLVVMVYAYTTTGVRFGGLLLTGLVALYVGNKLRAQPDRSIGALMVYAASALIAGTLITSPFVQKPLEWVNQKKDEVELLTLSACGSEMDLTDGSKPSFTIGRNCYQDLRLGDKDPRFITKDVRFHGTIDNYLIYSWPENDVVRLSPNTKAFPDDAEELPIDISRFVAVPKTGTSPSNP